MLEKLDESEIQFMECFYNPVCMAETLFSDYDNLLMMEEDKLAHVRLGQLPLLSFEYLLDSDPEISQKNNFRLRKNVGDIFCIGGRLFGKTLFVEKIDLLESMAMLDNERVGFSSYDALHIEGVLEEVFRCLEHHPFFRIFDARIKRSPYQVQLTSGYTLLAINMNITGKKPGSQFFQQHFSRLYIEEASFETDEVYNKRRDSVSELGCIFRISGMTNFTKYAPIGRIFYDLSLKPWVVNFPQYINPNWDEREKAKAVKEFGGESSISYRVFVLGQVVEEGIAVFDMERVRHNYEETVIKHLELTKEHYVMRENILIVERPRNAEQLYICADIGETAPSEIIVVSKVDKIFKYLYNITLHNLTDKEQFEVFKMLVNRLTPNFVALDTTEGTGRAIFRSMEEIYPKDNLVWVAFNEKVSVDFERDDKNTIVLKDGKPIYREEYITEWSIKHLKDLFYEEKFSLPVDYKLDIQLNSVISMQSGNRIVYQCLNAEDHLFAAFRVFSIAQWQNEFALIRPIMTKVFSKTGV
jgi:hypothetical protein